MSTKPLSQFRWSDLTLFVILPDSALSGTATIQLFWAQINGILYPYFLKQHDTFKNATIKGLKVFNDLRINQQLTVKLLSTIND